MPLGRMLMVQRLSSGWSVAEVAQAMWLSNRMIRYGLALPLGLLSARSVAIGAPFVPVRADGDASGAAPLEV